MAARRRRRRKPTLWCAKTGSQIISCHRLKRHAKKAARKHRGRVVRGHK